MTTSTTAKSSPRFVLKPSKEVSKKAKGILDAGTKDSVSSVAANGTVPQNDVIMDNTKSIADVHSNNWNESENIEDSERAATVAEPPIPSEDEIAAAPTSDEGAKANAALPVPLGNAYTVSKSNTSEISCLEGTVKDNEASQILVLCKNAFIKYSESFITFAYYLHLIKENEWYKLEEYGRHSTMSKFAKATFKLNHSQFYNYLNIWEFFGELGEGTTPKLKSDYKDYKLTQLIALCPLNEKERAAATADMTVQKIKSLGKKAEREPAQKRTERNLTDKQIRSFLKEILSEHSTAIFTITASWK